MSTMSKVLRGLVTASALAICLPAHALVTVAGITWDPDAPGDFIAQGGSVFQFTRKGFEAANANGTFMDTSKALATPLIPNAPNTVYQNGGANPGVIEGFGVISLINGDLFGKDVASRQLTVIYGGMDIFANGASAFGSNIGGSPWIRMYSDSSTSASSATADGAANAANGTLFLELALATSNNIGFSYVGPTGINSGPQNTDQGGGRQFTVEGDFQVVGGAAAAFFSSFSLGIDLSSSNSTSNFEQFFTVGGASFQGDTIPEPGSLALLGLSLIGVAALRRRKAA